MNERLKAWLDTKLVPNWRKAYKMLSVHGIAAMGTMGLVWSQMSDSHQMAVAGWLAHWLHMEPGDVIATVAVVTIYLRLKPQPALAVPAADEVAP